MKEPGVVILCTILMDLITWSPIVWAGSGEPEVIHVNMTPDSEVTQESTDCHKEIISLVRKSKIGTTYGISMKRIGETPLRRRVGVKKGGKHFMSWTGKQFYTADPLAESFDVVVLVDCRPESQMVDILISAPVGIVRLQSRSRVVNKAMFKWLAQAISLHFLRAWQP